MAGISLQIGNIVLLLAVIFVVVGLIFAALIFFKKSCDLTDDDHLHYKRALLLWVGAAALSAVAIYAASAEKRHGKGLGLHLGVSSSGRSASLI